MSGPWSLNTQVCYLYVKKGQLGLIYVPKGEQTGKQAHTGMRKTCFSFVAAWFIWMWPVAHDVKRNTQGKLSSEQTQL